MLLYLKLVKRESLSYDMGLQTILVICKPCDKCPKFSFRNKYMITAYYDGDMISTSSICFPNLYVYLILP